MNTTTYQPALALSPEERTELDNAMIAISARLGDLHALRARLGPTSHTFSRAFSSALDGLTAGLVSLEAAADIAREEQEG